MLPDRVSNPGPLTYESGALPIALRGPARSTLNPLYIGRLFHCYMLDESIYHFGDIGVYFVAFILFLMENPDSKQCRP